MAANCTGGSTSTGSYFVNAEVEPFVAADPRNPNHLVATWQQDRWTDGGSRALMTATSFDGGRTWTRVLQPMSRCGGGTPANGGLWVAWQDGRFSGGQRDAIALSPKWAIRWLG